MVYSSRVENENRTFYIALFGSRYNVRPNVAALLQRTYTIVITILSPLRFTAAARRRRRRL